jgi:Smg protein
MKETALDVLMYLFEHYQEYEFASSGKQVDLNDELVAAGFPIESISEAFAWLDGLAEQRQLPLVFAPSGALRIYAREEMSRLPVECRGFLMYLEQLGILDANRRELVIDRLMALREDIDLERVKWVCLLVLMNQPDAEDAYTHLEELVYYEGEFAH